tara:strand:+ start:47 stop:736 length:690 start_codon:yes stop_codon:yes gene_type:complete
MRFTFASYNIHKGVGLDRRRDPERILAVLHEMAADIVVLQEVDRRFGARETALPRQLVEEAQWQIAAVARRPLSIGWHGNAVLVRRDWTLHEAARIDLPVLEPRGAVSVVVEAPGGLRLQVAGMHLDLSGFRRRHQVAAICAAMGRPRLPTIMMGDLNEWSREKGALAAFDDHWRIVTPGPSYPTRRPVARLDRAILSDHWTLVEAGVHHSALSAQASDHLPIRAVLEI